ncbi:MAG: GDP-mannose 4,6-dehydratase [Rhodospirillales bacterium]|nr:GDP-mannose 4,6-dehydratase [Rhodospirillales bacterium]
MAARRIALIVGISGQVGPYLAQFLLDKGYDVHGTTRQAPTSPPANLVTLNIADRVKLHRLDLGDADAAAGLFKQVTPTEIYNLAGPSSVGRSFAEPRDSYGAITLGTLGLLEGVRRADPTIRFYNAASSECFGDTGPTPATETTPFRPVSPYAAAKTAAFWEIASFRDAYGLFACSGIVFNHESPLRPASFVTRKIIDAARRIAAGTPGKLALGRLDIERDWGWAPEYVDAMWRMLQAESPEDYVLATGESRRLEDFVAAAFSSFSLDWRDHVESDPSLFRPVDIARSTGNPEKARRKLGWAARHRMADVVRMTIG